MTKANKMGAGREVPRIRTNSLSLCSKKVDQTGQIHTCKNKNKPKELRCKLQLKAQRTVRCLKKDTQVSAAIVSQSATINKAAKRRFNSFAFFRSPPGYSGNMAVRAGSYRPRWLGQIQDVFKMVGKNRLGQAAFSRPNSGKYLVRIFLCQQQKTPTWNINIGFSFSYKIFMASSCSLKHNDNGTAGQTMLLEMYMFGKPSLQKYLKSSTKPSDSLIKRMKTSSFSTFHKVSSSTVSAQKIPPKITTPKPHNHQH